MQIKTGFAIGTGMVIGLFWGMNVSEETKTRIMNGFKKKLIFALTGEEWNPKTPNEHTTYTTKYSDYFRKSYDDEKKRKMLKFVNEIMTFDTELDANEVLSKMKLLVKAYGYISINDVAIMRKMNVNLNCLYDSYGWTKNTILTGSRVHKITCDGEDKWKILIQEQASKRED